MVRQQDVSAYAGLVHKTARTFHRAVGLEWEDMCQELWIKVCKAQGAYDTGRSKMSEQAFVYSCLANLVKDLQRVATAHRNAPLFVLHIEDYRDSYAPDAADAMDYFDAHYQHVTHDEAYATVEGTFTMPSTVTPGEEMIVLLTVLGYSQTEIAEQLDIAYQEVVKAMRTLREKFAAWRPEPAPVAPAELNGSPQRERVAA